MRQPAVIAAPIAALASTRLTLVLLGGLGVAIIAGYRDESVAAVALSLALGALVLNFAAAVAVRPVFRRQAPLLVVHGALLAVVVLAGLGKMTRLQGRVELTQGVPFEGTLIDKDAGPWHPAHLEQARFVNEGFAIEYAPGLKRGRTRNTVRWVDAAGRTQRAVIGDHEPLVLAGYRFTTTANKGFAPVFGWSGHGGRDVVSGAVHLPSYPAQALRQAQSWTLPDGTEVWIKLASEDVLIERDRAGAFRLPPVQDVIVRVGDQRHTLRPGQVLELPTGRLEYAGLRTWMGYRVFYDWTLPWLLVASTLAALALGVHFWMRFRAVAWTAQTAPSLAGGGGQEQGGAGARLPTSLRAGPAPQPSPVPQGREWDAQVSPKG